MRSERKGILMISAQFVPEVFGGAINQCLKLSQQLEQEGYQITVLTSRNTFKLASTENLNGINIVRIYTGAPPQLMGKHTFSSLIWLIGCTKWFIKHHKKIDIIHVHQAKFQAFIGSLLGKWFNKPVIVKVGNADYAFDLNSLQRKAVWGKSLYTTVTNNTTKFIAISAQIQKNFKQHHVDDQKVISIPNGVYQPFTFEEIQRKKGVYRLSLLKDVANSPVHCKYFLSAGRLSKEKNILLLLSVFSEVVKTNPDIKLIILGDGPLRKQCESLAAEKGITDFVEFKGYVKNVTEYMIASDFFLLPSSVEGMSNSLLEAMSVGLIPIATKISGNTDLINEKNGFLIGKPLAINLKEAIVHAAGLNNAVINEMQLENFEKIRQQYKMEIVTQKYIHLYNTIQ